MTPPKDKKPPRRPNYKNVYNIFSGKPIRSARKKRKNVEVPELQVREEIAVVADFLNKNKHQVTDITLALKTETGETWVFCQASPETQAYLGHLITQDLLDKETLEESE